MTPDALEETRRLSECGVALEPFDPANADQRAWVLGADAVIDAIFGVGLSRPIGEGTAFAAAVDWINESPGSGRRGGHRQRRCGGHRRCAGQGRPGGPDRHLHPAQDRPGGGGGGPSSPAP